MKNKKVNPEKVQILKIIMEQRRLRPEDIAKLAGITRTLVYYWLSGKRDMHYKSYKQLKQGLKNDNLLLRKSIREIKF